MFDSRLFDIDEKQQKEKTRETEGEEEIKGTTIVSRVVDNGRGDEGADEGTGFTDDGEEGEEEEFFAAGRDFGDHLDWGKSKLAETFSSRIGKKWCDRVRGRRR